MHLLRGSAHVSSQQIAREIHGRQVPANPQGLSVDAPRYRLYDRTDSCVVYGPFQMLQTIASSDVLQLADVRISNYGADGAGKTAKCTNLDNAA